MENSPWKDILIRNWGKVLGGFTGLIIGLLFIIFGFWKGLLIILCIAAGILVGIRLEDGDGFPDIMSRVRPK